MDPPPAYTPRAQPQPSTLQQCPVCFTQLIVTDEDLEKHIREHDEVSTFQSAALNKKIEREIALVNQSFPGSMSDPKMKEANALCQRIINASNCLSVFQITPEEINDPNLNLLQLIKDRYKQLVLQVHPDKNRSPSAKPAFHRLESAHTRAVELVQQSRSKDGRMQLHVLLFQKFND